MSRMEEKNCSSNASKGFRCLEKKVSFRLDEQQFGELLSWSRKEGFPVSTIVRHLVLRYLDDRRRFAKVM